MTTTELKPCGALKLSVDEGQVPEGAVSVFVPTKEPSKNAVTLNVAPESVCI